MVLMLATDILLIQALDAILNHLGVDPNHRQWPMSETAKRIVERCWQSPPEADIESGTLLMSQDVEEDAVFPSCNCRMGKYMSCKSC